MKKPSNLYYKSGHLHFGLLSPLDIKEFSQNKKTPFYLYHLGIFQERLSLLEKSVGEKTKIHYAMKANPHLDILKLLQKLNHGVDVVSGGEMDLALKAGFKNDHIIYSGVGKTKEELTQALSLAIKQINVESAQELTRIGELCRSLKKRVSVALRINPHVNPKSHPYIVTGFQENKFGVDVNQMLELKEILNKYKDSITLIGLTLHIGSQIIQVEVFREAIQKTKSLFTSLKSEGFKMKSLNVGGGLGIFYSSGEESKERELMKSYGKMLQSETSSLACEVLCEPGRWLVARSGLLITEIQYIKKTEFKNFLVVDTGMNHLLRPALYQSYHRILPLLENKKNGKQRHL